MWITTCNDSAAFQKAEDFAHSMLIDAETRPEVFNNSTIAIAGPKISPRQTITYLIPNSRNELVHNLGSGMNAPDVIIEIWYPGCGKKPTVCEAYNDENIIDLGAGQYIFRNPPLFRDSPDTPDFYKTATAYLKGFGISTQCGEDKNKVLILGMSKEALDYSISSFSNYYSSPGYFSTIDPFEDSGKGFFNTLIVTLEDSAVDRSYVRSYIHPRQDLLEDSGKGPLVIYGGKGLGDLAQIILNSEGGLVVIGDAKRYFELMKADDIDSLGYQLFALMNGLGDKNERYVAFDRLHLCSGSAKDSFYSIDLPVVVSRDPSGYEIAKDSILCLPGAAPEFLKGEYMGSKDTLLGSGISGVYVKKILNNFGDSREFIAGLDARSTNTVARIKDEIGSTGKTTLYYHRLFQAKTSDNLCAQSINAPVEYGSKNTFCAYVEHLPFDVYLIAPRVFGDEKNLDAWVPPPQIAPPEYMGVRECLISVDRWIKEKIAFAEEYYQGKYRETGNTIWLVPAFISENSRPAVVMLATALPGGILLDYVDMILVVNNPDNSALERSCAAVGGILPFLPASGGRQYAGGIRACYDRCQPFLKTYGSSVDEVLELGKNAFQDE